MKQRNTGWIALFLAPTCIIFLLIFAIPLVMVFATSLFDYRLLPRTFEFIGFSNFIKTFTQDAKFLPVLKNTVVLDRHSLRPPCGAWHRSGIYSVQKAPWLEICPRNLHDSEYYLSVRYRHDLFESVQCAVRRFELFSRQSVWNTYSITGYSTRPPLSRL